MKKNYREKIYKYYSSNRIGKLAPETIDGFKSREFFFLYIINKFFPKNKNIKILELGCGYGAFAYYIQNAGYINYVGIDGSEEQINEANRLGIKNVIFADIKDYLQNLDEESIDLIIAIDVIEHFTKEELSDLIDELYRILKKNGLIIMHQPNAESIWGCYMRYGDFTHELSFTTQSIGQIFLSSGFSEVKNYEDKPIIHGVKSFIRYVLWEYLLRKIFCFIRLVENGGCDKDSIFSQNFLTVVKK